MELKNYLTFEGIIEIKDSFREIIFMGRIDHFISLTDYTDKLPAFKVLYTAQVSIRSCTKTAEVNIKTGSSLNQFRFLTIQ